MLKRTLVASALLASFAGQAATLTSASDDIYSTQGSASLAAFVASDLTVVLGAEYQAGDTVTLTFNANLAADILPTVTTAAAADNASESVALGFLSSDANSLTYRVTSVSATDGADTTVNSTITLSGVAFDADSVKALTGSVTGTYSAATSTGITIDNADTNTDDDILSLDDQFEVTIGADNTLSAVVDVTNERLTFVEGVTDSFTVTLANNNLESPAVITETVTTLTGDFSWILDTDLENDVFDQTVVSVDDGSITSITDNTIVITNTNAVDEPGNLTVTFTPAENAVGANETAIVASDFTVSTTITYEDTGPLGDAADAVEASLTTSGLNAGEFTLNGATAKVRAYPISDNIEQFLWVTNDGSFDGDVSVVAIANGETFDLGVVGTASAQTLTYIGTAVNEGLAAEGLTSGRVQLDVTVNAPAAAVNVYAGYKVVSDADRLSLTVD